MDLIEFTAGYLETRGFQISRRGRDLLVGNQLSLGEEKHTILVWVPSLVPEQSFSSQQEPYLSRFKDSLKEYPGAQKFMLVSTFEGLSTAFRSKAKRDYDVNIRVPIQLFDTPYKWDEARESTSAANELSIRGKVGEKRRVPQSYKLINGSDTRQSDDILDTLLNKMTIPASGGVHFIVGPAGIVNYQPQSDRKHHHFCKSANGIGALVEQPCASCIFAIYRSETVHYNPSQKPIICPISPLALAAWEG